MSRQRNSLAAAQAALDGVDPILDLLVATHGPARLPAPRPTATRFTEIAESIAYQQLHGNAAATIWGRVVLACDGLVNPESVMEAGEERLRACGLSGSKTKSMLDLSAKVHSGELALSRIGRLDDEAVIESLTRVWGIGRWTAQMFLMFTLGRLDVWPAGDYGVRNGYAVAWGLDEHPTEAEMPLLGERFVGGRSLVAWYCWRAADTAGGRSQ